MSGPTLRMLSIVHAMNAVILLCMFTLLAFGQEPAKRIVYGYDHDALAAQSREIMEGQARQDTVLQKHTDELDHIEEYMQEMKQAKLRERLAVVEETQKIQLQVLIAIAIGVFGLVLHRVVELGVKLRQKSSGEA